MSNAAAISAKRRKIVKAFREGAACSPEYARPLGELGVSRSLVFLVPRKGGWNLLCAYRTLRSILQL